MPNDTADDNAVHILGRGERNGRNLAAVAPLREAGHGERLDKNGGQERKPSGANEGPLLRGILAKFLLDLRELLVLSVVLFSHLPPFADELDAEDGEEDGGKRAGDLLIEEERERLADDGGDDGHEAEGGESAGPDDEAGGLHGEDGGDEEGAIAQFAREDEQEALGEGGEKAAALQHDLHRVREQADHAADAGGLEVLLGFAVVGGERGAERRPR